MNADGGAATTYATPQIVATDYGFRVYHTGTDGRIYYAGLSINAGQVGLLGGWRTVPGVITRNNMAPAVTAMPRGESVYLAYHGATSDQIYGAFFNGFGDDRYNTGWQAPRAIPGVFSSSTPSIAYNNSWNHLVLTWAGTDLQVNYSTQLYGSAYWSTPWQIAGCLNPEFADRSANGQRRRADCCDPVGEQRRRLGHRRRGTDHNHPLRWQPARRCATGRGLDDGDRRA